MDLFSRNDFFNQTSLFEKKSKLGDCFNAAYDYSMKHHDVILVHGYVSGQGELSGIRYAHAWNELGDEVIDNSNGRSLKLPKIVYYSIGNIRPEECKYYTHEELLKISVEYGHKGPYEIENKSYIDDGYKKR